MKGSRRLLWSLVAGWILVAGCISVGQPARKTSVLAQVTPLSTTATPAGTGAPGARETAIAADVVSGTAALSETLPLSPTATPTSLSPVVPPGFLLPNLSPTISLSPAAPTPIGGLPPIPGIPPSPTVGPGPIPTGSPKVGPPTLPTPTFTPITVLQVPPAPTRPPQTVSQPVPGSNVVTIPATPAGPSPTQGPTPIPPTPTQSASYADVGIVQVPPSATPYPTPTISPTPAPTQTPTWTVQPTNTPLPTYTPPSGNSSGVPPTSTPYPTFTASATVTPIPVSVAFQGSGDQSNGPVQLSTGVLLYVITITPSQTVSGTSSGPWFINLKTNGGSLVNTQGGQVSGSPTFTSSVTTNVPSNDLYRVDVDMPNQEAWTLRLRQPP